MRDIYKKDRPIHNLHMPNTHNIQSSLGYKSKMEHRKKQLISDIFKISTIC